jgi:hypothetical protein
MGKYRIRALSSWTKSEDSDSDSDRGKKVNRADD